MDANQWPLLQANLDHHVLKPVQASKQEEEVVVERKPRPQKDCPRCKSTNTKFCYYNNYSLSQPRYFCKTCRRYWTEGGTLRKVPVGGGSRKNKTRSTSSSPSSSLLIKKKVPAGLQPSTYNNYQNPSKIHGVHDLNLGYDDNQLTAVTDHVYNTSNCVAAPILSFGELGKNVEFYPNPNINLSSSSSCHLSFLGTTMPLIDANSTNIIVNANGVFNPSHSHEYFKLPPRFNFCVDGGQVDHNQIGYGNIQQEAAEMLQGTSTRTLYPYENIERKFTTSTVDDHDHHYKEEEERENKGECNGYWGGLLGGGSW